MIFTVLAEPRETFNDVHRTALGAPVAVNLLLFLSTAFLMFFALRAMVYNGLASALGEMNVPSSVMASVRVGILITLARDAVAIPFRWFITTGILFILFYSALKGLDKLRDVFAILVLSELILSLMRLVNACLLHVRGIDNIQQPQDLFLIPGLHFFMSDLSHDFVVFTLASSVNVFAVWYVTVMTLGFTEVFKCSKCRAFGMAAAAHMAPAILATLTPTAERAVLRILGFQLH